MDTADTVCRPEAIPVSVESLLLATAGRRQTPCYWPSRRLATWGRANSKSRIAWTCQCKSGCFFVHCTCQVANVNRGRARWKTWTERGGGEIIKRFSSQLVSAGGADGDDGWTRKKSEINWTDRSAEAASASALQCLPIGAQRFSLRKGRCHLW